MQVIAGLEQVQAVPKLRLKSQALTWKVLEALHHMTLFSGLVTTKPLLRSNTVIFKCSCYLIFKAVSVKFSSLPHPNCYHKSKLTYNFKGRYNMLVKNTN